MLDMGVWRHVKRYDCPNDRRLVGCRWVIKVKRNGVCHFRLVAKGFSQIPDNAFQYGDLEHEIYMKIPEGYDEVINPRVDKEDCLIL